MNARTTSNNAPTGLLIHPGFLPYVAVNQKGVSSLLKAIAFNGVGQAIVLAALGILAKSMTMPNMSREPRCTLVLPKNAWVNNLKWMHNQHMRQTLLLEIICWLISGAVAEFAFDESDHYGNLGLEGVEGSYKFLSAYESAHNVRHDYALGGCTFVVERLLSKHFEVAAAMAAHLAAKGSLNEEEIARYLSCVGVEALGQQAMATFEEPWIEDEADRVSRMLIGVG
jgi:hypothetical protein